MNVTCLRFIQSGAFFNESGDELMNNYETIMVDGVCSECGNSQHDGLSCYEQFGYPLAWEHDDPELYEVHFWLVSCYMIQHPSVFTEEGYRHLIELFVEAYDQDWNAAYTLKKNRELIKKISKITNPVSSQNRVRERKDWVMTIGDIYVGGKANAMMNIKKWKDCVRNEVKNR